MPFACVVCDRPSHGLSFTGHPIADTKEEAQINSSFLEEGTDLILSVEKSCPFDALDTFLMNIL